MGATVVVIRSNEEWEIINRVLVELKEGGIIVPPIEAARFDQKYAEDWEYELPGDLQFDYDFGGEADIWIDVLREGNHADEAVTYELNAQEGAEDAEEEE